MSFLRPEAREALGRYSEAIIGAGLAAFGLYLFFDTHGVLHWMGIGAVLAGLSFLWSGLQSARLKRLRDGVGMVQVVEREIAYLSPYGGTSLSLDQISRISIRKDRNRPPAWILNAEGEVVEIPVNAHDGDTLFDTFCALPGFDSGQAVREMTAPGEATPDITVIWQRPNEKLH